ncbi:MAG: hypothetical protein Athens101410_276 [Parcubacteria group bacterium Athens1014_10]|nr:MAG: hypothetical protein Athens101410_276 [Parcubacteria group bacterium Athens1014_10]TSD04985.1 MAG: hypothetical protein Athens071412_527 [Parcubacteria group bacterium Athens0714_12]
MLTYSQVKKNPQVLEFIKATEIAAGELSYTDHGIRHAQLVADRARTIAIEVGLSKKEQELSAIAGFCHDMGMFLGRSEHHYWGSLVFSQIFLGKIPTDDLVTVMQAIVNHDKEGVIILNKISAILILADKADVHKSRVIEKDMKKVKKDIHDRVNYAVEEIRLSFKDNNIILKLKVDDKFVPVMEYFEIFTPRMAYCRSAAQYLGYKFGLEINNFKLL